MKNDMTQGSEWKHIFFFSLPVMLGFLLQQLYNTVDGIVVGNYVGEEALAAVGTCFAPSMAFLSLSMGLGSGSGVLISQLFGAKQMDELKKAVSTAMIMLIALGALLSVIGALIAGWIMRVVLNLSEGELLDMASSYFAIYCTGLVFQFTYNSISSILRAIGDSKPTLYFLAVSSVMNIVLDLLFVAVFGWGVAGAAVATVISQVVCTVVSFIYMRRKYELFRFKRSEFIFDKEKCKLCLRLGIPTTLQQCVISFGNVAIQRVINHFGPSLMAACTVGLRVENYIFIPIFGIQIGMSTFAGQNMGAGEIDRIMIGRRRAAIMSVAICIFFSVIAYLVAEPMSALFGVEGDSLVKSVEHIRFLCFFFFFFAYYMVHSATLVGTGDVLFATACTLTGLASRVACTYAGVYLLGMDYPVLWQVTPIGWLICMALGVTRFWSGRWKSKGVVKKKEAEA